MRHPSKIGRSAQLALAIATLIPCAGRADDDRDRDRDRPIMERFLAVLEKSPRRGTALDRVYGYHVERGELDSFLKTYRDRVGKDPNDGPAWMMIGLVESQRGRDAAAVEAFRKAETSRPDDALPSYYLGQALVLIGQPDAAAEAFERALTRKPGRAELLEIFQALGRVHQRARRDDRALEVWSRLEKLFPDDPKVQEQIASALAEESRWDRALDRYEALAKSARDAYRRVRFRSEAADIKARLGRSADALRDYESLLAQVDPESWLAREVRRKVEEVFTRDDDLAGLAAYYEKWVDAHPDDLEALARLARTLAGQGRSADARRRLDQALKLAPTDRRLRLALIDQLARDGKFAEAAGQYEALDRAQPDNPDVVREWGRTLLKDATKPEAERKALASKAWNRLVDARRDDPSTLAQVADWHRQAGMVDAAIALYKQAVDRDPRSPQFREYLGEYYHALKRPADALAAWRGIAEGPERSASALGRLGEILAGYGYKAEAVDALAEAVRLEPNSLPSRLKLADLLRDLRRFDEAEAQLVAAPPLAEDEAHREDILARRIALDEAAGRLSGRVAALKAELAGPKAADAPTWRALARYLEADRRPAEAIDAARKAVDLDGNSAAARGVLARVLEQAGRYVEAADAHRALANVDRRGRTEAISNVARLEARLGRKAQALEAGRELLAASPGNPDALNTYSELCFQLGEDEEGLQALRRAVRSDAANARDVANLAEALARLYRTEEAIEQYWKAFEKQPDLDHRLGYVVKLAELHLRRDQLDRLIARLERLQAEEGHRREGTLALAQAYSVAGDLGAARKQLESLVDADSKDSALLKQLAKLAEDEGDYPAAVRFQKQIYESNPNNDSANKLTRLAVQAGEVEVAEAIWDAAIDADRDFPRVIAAVDGLSTLGKHEVALATAGRLLRKHPGDWEALYREARALDALNRPAEAMSRYREILAQRLDDDDPAAIIKAQGFRLRTPIGEPADRVGLYYRLLTGPRNIRGLTGLEPGISASLLQGWTPGDFGQARMYALARELAQARRDGTEAEWLAARGKAAGPRSAWDDFYVALLTAEKRPSYEAAVALVRAVGPARDVRADYALIAAASERNLPPGPMGLPSLQTSGPDRTPPLPAAEVDLVRDAFRSILRRKEPILTGALIADAQAELRRAGRLGEIDSDYRELVGSANDVTSIEAGEYMAADRGDFDALRTLSAAFYRLPPGQRTLQPNLVRSYAVVTPRGQMPLPAYFLGMAMKAGADARRYPEIIRAVDDGLAESRTAARVAERARAGQVASTSTGGSARNSYPVFTMNRTGVSSVIDYPMPNPHLESGSILVLRAAFTFLKRDAQLDGWIEHLKAVVASAAKGDDRSAEVQARLAYSAVLWWAEGRDDAVAELTRAVALLPNDVDLKFALAEVRGIRREFDDALALLDSVEASDQESTKRREWQALQMAVQARRPDRARLAAERLFGLRLDTPTQIQLASQMHQLGLHDLADAVLARTRRQVGASPALLADLMAEYRRQGNGDAAVQIALQLLRRTSGRTGVSSRVEDPAQRSALAVLAGSGKLDDLIARAEGQAKANPGSLAIQQSLALYYQAANRLDRLREANQAILKLRPDDAALRIQVANQLAQAGDIDGALGHYREAFRKDPSLLGYYSMTVFAPLQAAGRYEDLVKLLDEVGLKTFNDRASIRTLIQALLKDPKTFELGVGLLAKAWEAYPEDRGSFLAAVALHDAFWTRPGAYEYARDAALTSQGTVAVGPWAGLDGSLVVGSWDADGRMRTVATRLLETASREGKLDDLARALETMDRGHPGTKAGRALLGAVRIRQGRVDEGRTILEELLADPESPPPFNPLLVLGQEVRDVPGCEGLPITLYERASKDDRAWVLTRTYMKSSPPRQLAILYRKAGRPAEALALARRAEAYLRAPANNGGNPAIGALQRMTSLAGLGGMYLDASAPLDAIRAFDDVLASPDDIALARTYPRRDGVPNADWAVGQAEEGLDRALKSFDREALGPTLDALIRPLDPTRPVDLRVVVHPRTLDRSSVVGLLAMALELAPKEDPARFARAKSDLGALAKARPSDIEAQVASALASLAGADSKAIGEVASRLDRLVESSPLRVLSEGARPDPRDRDEAARRVGLWLAARSCWRDEANREVGDRLAAKALEGARRLPDPAPALAMLRELGQIALDRGDRAGAEARWTSMLDLISAEATVTTPSPTPTPTPTPAQAQAPTRVRPVGAAPRPSVRAPAPSVERFGRASEIARLAAGSGMEMLSLRAIRDVSKGGPPAVPSALAMGTTSAAISRSATAQGIEIPPDPALALAESSLVELAGLWAGKGFDKLKVYETLRDVVLPEARPTEAFAYDPKPGRSAGPSKVLQLLVRSARDAETLDDLERRAKARQAQPAARATVLALLAAIEEARR